MKTVSRTLSREEESPGRKNAFLLRKIQGFEKEEGS
jgi:hypothetical protein